MSCDLVGKHVRNAGSLNLQLELEFHLCGRASTGSHRMARFPRHGSPDRRRRSPPHLRGKPPRCGHRAPRCRRWSYACQNIPLQYNLCLSFFHDPSWLSCSCWNLLLLFSETRCTKLNWMQLDAIYELRITVLRFVSFVCKVDSTQGALSLSDTDAMAHLPTDHRANNLVGLDFEHVDTGAKHKVFHKNHEIFHIFRVVPGICRSSPFQESKCHQMFIWQKQPWLNLSHIIIAHTHTHITWYII